MVLENLQNFLSGLEFLSPRSRCPFPPEMHFIRQNDRDSDAEPDSFFLRPHGMESLGHQNRTFFLYWSGSDPVASKQVAYPLLLEFGYPLDETLFPSFLPSCCADLMVPPRGSPPMVFRSSHRSQYVRWMKLF